jgi:hypothetical protein
MKRNAFKKALEKKGVHVCGDTEDFDGSKGGIWCSAEHSGHFDYYAESPSYDLGVQKDIRDYAQKHGWYFEWNDCGTIMAWEA